MAINFGSSVNVEVVLQVAASKTVDHASLGGRKSSKIPAVVEVSTVVGSRQLAVNNAIYRDNWGLLREEPVFLEKPYQPVYLSCC